jgi:hypothetical protein
MLQILELFVTNCEEKTDFSRKEIKRNFEISLLTVTR